MEEKMNTFDIEYTNTLNGEANYCWVKRFKIVVRNQVSMAMVKDIAKELTGLTGSKGIWNAEGDGYSFKPQGSCTILFITFRE